MPHLGPRECLGPSSGLLWSSTTPLSLVLEVLFCNDGSFGALVLCDCLSRPLRPAASVDWYLIGPETQEFVAALQYKIKVMP